LVATVMLAGAALGASLALLVPAGQGYASAVAPLGKLGVTLDTPPVRSIVYDRFGTVMTTLFTEDRSPVPLEQVPRSLVDAVIAIEDRRFYEHNGVDYGGIFRALFKNVDVGGIAQGGSTITQQLVKNTMSTNRERDVKTKVREATLAIRLEREMSKDEILERYLNVIYFGNGAYGVQAAAERYFNKPLQELSIAESALLAGIIQSPAALDPVTHPDLAARRRAEVLAAMVETGKITEQEAAEARSVPLPTSVSNKLLAQRDYFMDEVVRRLMNDPEFADALGPTPSARYNAVFRGGLQITTSYDPILQYVAASSVAEVAPQHPIFTAAVVLIDNADGGVRAMVAGRNFEAEQTNLVTQGKRQAGSAFKVFTLAAALLNGYSPRDSVSGAPVYVPQIDSRWNPLRGDCHGGTPSLTRALAISDNCAWVRTLLSLGPGNLGSDGAQKVLDTAKLMGLDISEMQPVVSTTLGTNGTTPLDMAQGYSVLAQDGILRPARFVTKIVAPDGDVLYEANTAGTRVLPENVARTEIEMMTHVITEGTARGSANIGRPAAGKTGTTDKKADAWFVGFTPEYTAAVWMGDPKATTPMENVNGIAVFGGTYPARIWAALMKAALGSSPERDFPPPDRSQLPTPQYIDQKGRHLSTRYAQPSPGTAPPETTPPPPTAPAPTTPTTAKPAPTTTVAPATTVAPSTTVAP
jgi:penicillin-binding protein 1A